MHVAESIQIPTSGMLPPTHIILDFLTDTSESTRLQLIQVVAERLRGNDNSIVTVLSTDNSGLESFPQKVISSDKLDAIFKAKCNLDNTGTLEFLFITSLLFKKYWESVLTQLFSHVHVWAVLGVDVPDQAVELGLPDVSQVEADVKSFLRSLPGNGEVEIIRTKTIPDDMFNAGYHTRSGGISQLAPMASMNMLFSLKKVDSIAVVKENRRRLAVAAGFDFDRLEIAKTNHGNDVWVVGTERAFRYDGLVTNIPGVTLAAAGADCCVILLADVKTGSCGAVHAGWMGTVSGAVKNTLGAMIEHFNTQPKDIRASVGPSVGAECFDLPPKDAQVLIDLDPTLVSPSSLKPGWLHLDLARANAIMLESMGVERENIDLSTAECTACNKDKYFSHRRDGIPFGNQYGFISCREK